MGYKSIQAIYVWPDKLSDAVSDRVRGVLSRRVKPTRKRTVEATNV